MREKPPLPSNFLQWLTIKTNHVHKSMLGVISLILCSHFDSISVRSELAALNS